MRRLIDADALKESVHAHDYMLKDCLNSTDKGMFTVGIMQAIDEQPTVDAVPQWIPCSERLPEAPFGCLVTVEDEEPMTGALFPNLLPYFVGWDGEQWNDADGEQCPFEVLAWMPLPKPYEVEE